MGNYVPQFIFILVLIPCYALNNGLAIKPPMGWNSWVTFTCNTDCHTYPRTCISSSLYMSMAERLVTDGYAAVGYTSINVDDCWMSNKRETSGVLEANETRFAGGIPYLVQYMHSKNLSFGIYQSVDIKTCQKYPGSFGYFNQDAHTFAQWNVDYLKFDSCGLNGTLIPRAYKTMSTALNRTSRAMVYNCAWPLGMLDQYPDLINYTEIAAYCNSWRNFYDVVPKWESVLNIIDWYTINQETLASVHGPGAWNDPDMIVVGNPGLTDDQARVQMTMWSIWSAPLIMSNDLRFVTPSQKAILTNKAVIAIDQDDLADFGKLIFVHEGFDVYRKKVTPVRGEYTSFAFAILNRHFESRSYISPISSLGMFNPQGYYITELWTNHHMGYFEGEADLLVTIPPTGVAFFKAELA